MIECNYFENFFKRIGCNCIYQIAVNENLNLSKLEIINNYIKSINHKPVFSDAIILKFDSINYVTGYIYTEKNQWEEVGYDYTNYIPEFKKNDFTPNIHTSLCGCTYKTTENAINDLIDFYKSINRTPDEGCIEIVNVLEENVVLMYLNNKWNNVGYLNENIDNYKTMDGKIVSAHIKNQIKETIKNNYKKFNRNPKLVILHVGNDPASEIYMKGKKKDCEEVGIDCSIHNFTDTVSYDEIANDIKLLSNDNSVDGIILQLPLPNSLNKFENDLIQLINPKKDVDCFSEINIGKLHSNNPYMIPCTPYGIMKLFEYYNIDLTGKRCAIINRSNLVGKPLSTLMTSQNATVTLCHSKTKNIKDILISSDIIVCAVGKEKFITEDMVKQGVIIIDVGINRNNQGKVCGDVDFEKVKNKASFITPVPGGVGLMTRAMLLQNTLKSYLSN